jgi:hypothetical protein
MISEHSLSNRGSNFEQYASDSALPTRFRRSLHGKVTMSPDWQTLGPHSMKERLLQLHGASSACIVESTARRSVDLGRILQLDADIGLWETAIAGRPEHHVLAEARRELGFTVYSACSGLYLQAFSNLRVFLELSFAAIAFSVDDLGRRQWLADDTSFSFRRKLTDDDGLFSPAYLKAYRVDAINEAPEFRELARLAYSHCSEFVHGKLPVTKRLPSTLRYSDDALFDWAQTARSAARCVIFLIYCRYAEEFLLSDNGQLADTLTHSLGHLASVRKLIGLPVTNRSSDASS